MRTSLAAACLLVAVWACTLPSLGTAGGALALTLPGSGGQGITLGHAGALPGGAVALSSEVQLLMPAAFLVDDGAYTLELWLRGDALIGEQPLLTREGFYDLAVAIDEPGRLRVGSTDGPGNVVRSHPLGWGVGPTWW